MFAESHHLRTSLDMFAESYQIASCIEFKVISGVLGILGALAEFIFLRAFVLFKVLRARRNYLLEFKV